MAWTPFGRLLAARQTKLKPLLMDQRFIAGIGNIYADEILFAAGLRHDRHVRHLTAQEIRRLYRADGRDPARGDQAPGVVAGRRAVPGPLRRVGDFQRLHKVYDREGEPCPRCRATIVRVKADGRSSFFCPRCQI